MASNSNPSGPPQMAGFSFYAMVKATPHLRKVRFWRAKRSFGQPTQISRSVAAALGSFRRSDHVRQLRGEACVARLDVSGQSRGDLLEHPAVVVRIANEAYEA